MNKGFKIAIISTLLLFSLIGYFFYTNSLNSPSEYISIETAKKELVQYIETINKMEEQVFKYVDEEEAELAYLKTNSDIELKYADKKGVLEFFLATIALKDVDLFLESFDLYAISGDIHSSPEKNKDLVIEDLMTQLSRDGLLVKLGYKEVKGKFGADSNTVKVTFFYSDGLEATIPISFAKTHDHHNGEEVYSISTSVLEMLKDIKSNSKS
ncbi:hypothetical protein [Ferdinandcohnia sp. SAFN-114]|uniref:hypothetical protein n=1 Tax=Ferdinandcohnia sp. SAFN-114 TaxID=3387275 RepID=UPI003F7F19AE